MIRYAEPNALWLIFLPLLAYWLLPAAAKMYGDALKVPFVNDIIKIKNQTDSGGKHILPTLTSHNLFLWGIILWLTVVAALCRPQWVGEPQRTNIQSRDILLLVDISNSMSERDFIYQRQRLDRLTAVKYVVNEFVDKRTEDKIGLVLFGTRAYLQVPLTYDRQALKEVLWQTDAGMAGNSTSIGDAVGVALKNMSASPDDKRDKVIILLTDGENNDGSLSVAQAVNLAKEESVKIYTIGVGSDDRSFFGNFFAVPNGVGLDDSDLQQLALETKGAYFRAADLASLAQVYEAINRLEPQPEEGRFIQGTKELYYYPAGLALILLLGLIFIMRRDW